MSGKNNLLIWLDHMLIPVPISVDYGMGSLMIYRCGVGDVSTSVAGEGSTPRPTKCTWNGLLIGKMGFIFWKSGEIMLERSQIEVHYNRFHWTLQIKGRRQLPGMMSSDKKWFCTTRRLTMDEWEDCSAMSAVDTVVDNRGRQTLHLLSLLSVKSWFVSYQVWPIQPPAL